MSKRPTLKDVAAIAGVTTATVARVLKNSGYVAAETRERVLKAVEQTGYRVNSLAQSLKRNRSYVIGHLLKSTVPNPFYVEVARGVEEHARARGYTALTYNVQHDAKAERQAINTLLGWRADALIFSTPVEAANVEYVAQQKVPLAQVERPRSPLGHRIVVHNYPSAVAAMRHLTDMGHRRIAYVGASLLPEDGPAALYGYVERERFEAFRDVMQQVGSLSEDLISFGEAYITDVPTAQGHGYQATRALLARRDRPTAIMASNDILAAGALQAIHEAGLRVPDDVSVIGFDDTIAAFLTPLLTTVRLPARRLGEMAARLVIDQIEGHGEVAPDGLALEAELVIRKSTAPPPARP
ncbi:LacI family DNA-binding transcriptional regulator [Devosia sp. RR2S18]|uniref:LacI family DNA-binding transcriptional regulator n=1 Tax=Devosia rhizosphaerae TaxID=3049774 RepID=UPI002541ACD9|nr:LacI family DNA-binding transcriptional regulator [Devosia sp. RR2S18]WIJ25829.1 LacI family DNA-binding transcriptional regulator [Devosia sp. RR2S18]